MEDKASVDWEKRKRIKQEIAKAERDLLERETKEGKVNQGFLGAKEFGKKSGFNRDSESIRRSLERLATVGICFMVPAVIFGFIIMIMGTSLGQGFGTLFGWIKAIAEIVALLTTGVAFVCSIVETCRKKSGMQNALITSSASLLLYIIYWAVFFAVFAIH